MNLPRKNIHTPGPIRLLRWFCPPHLLEEIEGDLLQRYHVHRVKYGKRKALMRLARSVIKFIRPGILLRNKFSNSRSPLLLLHNNVMMAFRNIRKEKLFSSINIFGLTVSLSACILIFQYAYFELNYDRSPGTENTWRLYTSSYRNNELISSTALSSTVIAPKLKSKLPEIVQYARMYSTRFWFNCSLAYQDGNDLKVFNEKNLYYADPAALSIFSYRLLEGDPKTALAGPLSIVLSSGVAKKYFGETSALGKTIRLKGSNEDRLYTVTGVMTDPPLNSHLDANILASIATMEGNRGFEYSDSYTYLQLNPNADPELFISKLHSVTSELLPPMDDHSAQLDIEPVSDIHLHSKLIDQIRPTGNINSINLVLFVALIVLVMAWINCVNLTTARAFNRAKEVGIRKISGASRSQLVMKFLTEVVIFNAVSLISAIGLTYLIGPTFYSLVNVEVPQNYFLATNWGLTLYFLIAVFIIGVFVSGIFPALSISSFQPALVLKGKWVNRSKGISIRKVTVTFQFACAIVFAIAVFVFNLQFQFMKEQDLGVDIDHTLILRAPANVDSTYAQQLRGFKNDLNQLSIARSTSTSSVVPGNNISWTASVTRKREEPLTGENFIVNVIDPDYLQTYDLELLSGRNFTDADIPLGRFGSKIEPLIINKAGMQYLGFKNEDEAIGSPIYWGDIECRLVGIVDNYFQESLKRAIQPQLFTANNGPMFSVKLMDDSHQDFPQTLSKIQKVWNSYFPDNAFDYFFLEKAFDEQYAADEQLARVFNFFCVLALIISCLGLFALSLFSIQLRTKEVSIRKVLGASISHLIHLLTQEYLVLILVAGCIAVPLTFLGLSQWLNGFALHIEQGILLYVIPIGFVVIVAFSTVGMQTIKVILMNPTENLKHE